MKLTLALLLTFASIVSSAQINSEPVIDEGPKTLKNSFEQMLARSNRYQDFKVVKITSLNAFIQEVQDSIDLVRKDYTAEIKKVKSLRSEVGGLNDTITSKDSQIAQLSSERDNINTAGMSMDKKSFSTTMWIALLGLLGLLLILFFRNKSIASSQKALKSNLSQLEEDLNGTKKKALEREQELKREIQDYVNKIEAMGPPR